MWFTRTWIILIAALALFALPSVARANPPAPVFDTAAMPDHELAFESGTYAGTSAGLNPANLHAVIDADVRGWFRATSDISGVEMDVWWSTSGSDLIAANLRS